VVIGNRLEEIFQRALHACTSDQPPEILRVLCPVRSGALRVAAIDLFEISANHEFVARRDIGRLAVRERR
jgi:hypothetical protein